MERKNLSNKTKAVLAGIQAGIERALQSGNKSKAKYLKRTFNATLHRSK